MDTMINLHDLLRFLLYLAGIGALVFLMITLKNVAGILKVVKTKLETHEAVIDDTMQKLRRSPIMSPLFLPTPRASQPTPRKWWKS